jgi:chemotaxis protein CheD
MGSHLPAIGPNIVEVGVGRLATARYPSVLMTPALGSCVGVVLWDEQARRGGMAHVMLPRKSDTAERFASVAVEVLIQRLGREGSPPKTLVAKLAGGAAMFRADSMLASIGQRNTAEVRRQLDLAGVDIVAEDVGGSHARTIELHLDTGVLVVRSYLFGVREL